MTGGRQV
jgi:hypothetical protein